VSIGVKEARSCFSSLLDQVEKGKEVVIRRRGKEVARMIPPPGQEKHLPSLKDFRAGISVNGESLSRTVIRDRREERY
jgi:prevent-host-death family protein